MVTPEEIPVLLTLEVSVGKAAELLRARLGVPAGRVVFAEKIPGTIPGPPAIRRVSNSIIPWCYMLTWMWLLNEDRARRYLIYLRQHTTKPNLNPSPSHNPYSIECAVNMRTWKKMNSEADTCTAWVPVDRNKKYWPWEIAWRSMPTPPSRVKCCLR